MKPSWLLWNLLNRRRLRSALSSEKIVAVQIAMFGTHSDHRKKSLGSTNFLLNFILRRPAWQTRSVTLILVAVVYINVFIMYGWLSRQNLDFLNSAFEGTNSSQNLPGLITLTQFCILGSNSCNFISFKTWLRFCMTQPLILYR